MTTTAAAPQQIRSTIPARLDRLRWSPFHTRMVLGLGTAWILDGLSITVASSVTGVLTQSDTLGLTTTQAAATGSVYLLGEVVGAGAGQSRRGRQGLLVVPGRAAEPRVEPVAVSLSAGRVPLSRPHRPEQVARPAAARI